MKVGVLACKRASARHSTMLSRLGVEPVAYRLPPDLDDVVPCTAGRRVNDHVDTARVCGLFEPVARRLEAGIRHSARVRGRSCSGARSSMGETTSAASSMSASPCRAFGRQVDSFESDLDVAALGDGPLHAVFISAPVVEAVGDEVEVLARLTADRPVPPGSYRSRRSIPARRRSPALSCSSTSDVMSGHSKWATIKHKKIATDKARGKLFAKLLRQVEVAAWG